MHPVRKLRRLAGLTQVRLAELAGTSQATIAAYETGRKSPTLRTLDRLGVAAGLEVAVEFVTPLSREERRSLALHEAIAGRLMDDPVRVVKGAKANLARMTSVHRHALPLLREWKRILDRPVGEIRDALVDPRPRARELRHVTPFAGVLSGPERAEVYRAFRRSEAA